MYIGRRRNGSNEFYKEYLVEVEEKTVKQTKILFAVGLPVILYFIFQDIYLVKIPELLYCRIILIVPYLIYSFYLFLYQKKNRRATEILHFIFLFCFQFMSVAIVNTTVFLEAGLGYNSRMAMGTLIVSTFLVFIFSGICLRWMNIILGVSTFLSVFHFLFTPFISFGESLIFLSNFIFISIFLIVRSHFQENIQFEEFSTRKKYQKELTKNAEITEDLRTTLSENMELNNELEKMAVYDTLTGVVTRNAGIGMLTKNLEKAKRKKTKIAIVFVDVDNLKTVNDNLGHAEGDNLLIAIVNELKNRIRTSDYMIRIGGDEFLVVLSECNLDKAEILVKQIQQTLKMKKSKYEYSFSYGISVSDYNEAIDTDSLIRIADERMYKNKFQKKSLK